jgi:hypothetical protein
VGLMGSKFSFSFVVRLCCVEGGIFKISYVGNLNELWLARILAISENLLGS